MISKFMEYLCTFHPTGEINVWTLHNSDVIQLRNPQQASQRVKKEIFVYYHYMYLMGWN